MTSALRRVFLAFNGMLVLGAFLQDRDAGRAYRVGVRRKLQLALAFRRNHREVETLSTVAEHLEMAAAILRVPPDVPGDVVECGCYVGGSAVNLSLVCEMVGRRLIICDSFEGLPAPAEDDRVHVEPYSGVTDEYYESRFAASLDTVRGNLSAHGRIEVCEFVVGYFDESMKDFDRPVVAAFLDVDLVDSLKPCLTALWRNLQDGCRMYMHEARSMRLVSVFYDRDWWRERVGEEAPGFIGGGTGLPLLVGRGSDLGYAFKPRPQPAG